MSDLQKFEKSLESEEPAQSCSFCEKSADAVKTLIAGPQAYICDECVDVCAEIVSENRKETNG